MRRFNLGALVMSGFSSFSRGTSSKSYRDRSIDYRMDRRASAPAIVLAKSSAQQQTANANNPSSPEDAKQAEKLARLSAAIAAHNHAVVTQREKELAIENAVHRDQFHAMQQQQRGMGAGGARSKQRRHSTK
jgi:hypothetical protein